MRNFLNNLQLIAKLNVTTVISAVTIIIATIMFFIITNIFFSLISKNNLSKDQVQDASNKIISILHKIDYNTINHAINNAQDYKENNKVLYKELNDNISHLQQSDYLKNDKTATDIIKKIQIRIHGYKIIADSLREEVEEDSTDGLYAIMGLSSASQKIMYDLEQLNKKIHAIAQENIQELNQNIFYIKFFSILFISSLFFFLVYTNKIISSSILERIEQLKEEILSFFNFLSKKRTDVMHVTLDGKDEISEIAQIIDDNIYIAEDILKQERISTEIIEKKVAEATKELHALNDEVEATQERLFLLWVALQKRDLKKQETM